MAGEAEMQKKEREVERTERSLTAIGRADKRLEKPSQVVDSDADLNGRRALLASHTMMKS